MVEFVFERFWLASLLILLGTVSGVVVIALVFNFIADHLKDKGCNDRI